MVVTPNTELYLLKVPIEMDDKNQLTFSTTSAQESYFLGCTKIHYENFTYQRKDGVLRIPDNVDNIMDYNYVMYKNTSYYDKWFYAFITDMQYISDGMASVSIKTDVFQTWMFDINYKKCFVEREHVNDDTIGLHTVPEGLEMGDYINQEVTSTEEKSINFIDRSGTHNDYVVLGVTNTALQYAMPGNDYNRSFGGLTYLVFPTFGDCRLYISYAQTQLSEDNIYTAFMVPYLIGINGSGFQWISASEGFTFAYIEPSDMPTYLCTGSINKPTVLDKNYSPKNKKLLTFPYVYLNIDNNSGSVHTYMYEYFTQINGSYSSSCTFEVQGTITTGCSIKLYPIHYKQGKTALNTSQENYIESLDAGKLPTCSWTNDSYTNWLTQNAVNMPLGMAGSAISIVAGVGLIATGVGVGAGAGLIATGGVGIANSLKQVYEHRLIPETAKGGVNQATLNFAKGLTFTAYKMSIKEEYAKIIDDYFSAYGYKVNSFKIPNITGRLNWNYVKTIGMNITGEIPQKDLQEIKNML